VVRLKNLKDLYRLEQLIEDNYIHLIRLEIENEIDSYEYNYFFQNIIELTKKESQFISNLNIDELNKIKKIIHQENPYNDLNNHLILGNLDNAFYLRLENLIDSVLGDDYLSYINILRYDINQILFAFLKEIINNPYYEEIKDKLIYYKYNQVFMNPFSENDYFIDKTFDNVELETNNYRTTDIPAYPYIDKALLVLESTDFLCNLINIESFKNSNITYSYAILDIINVLSRLTLCEEDTLTLIYDDLAEFLENPSISNEIKELVNEMLGLLDNVKSRINWAR